MRVTVEIGRPRLPHRPSRRLLVAAALMAALAVPAGAVATSSFTGFNDVPPSNTFYAAINALAGAGITTGCGGGNFCPRDTISREAEAAFVNRGMPRAALASTPIATTTSTTGPAAATSVTITVGGLTALDPAAQQFVEVHGHVAIYGNGTAAGCPCNVGAWIADEAANQGQSTFSEFPAATDWQMDSGDVSWVFPAAPGSHTYTLWVVSDGTGTLNLTQPTLIASTLPFSDNGGNTITPQASIKKASGTAGAAAGK